MNQNEKVIDISKKTFFGVLGILFSLIAITIILTYVVPKGHFLTDNSGNILYNQYEIIEGASGINILKGIFAPVLLLFAPGGLAIIMLCIFLMTITGAFQVMNDVDGMKIIVQKLIRKFQNQRMILISIIVLIFMVFGSFFGLFEETLTLLPIIILLSLSMGYDSYTGFLMCIVATAFGFASAITNPFSLITASSIIDVSPTNGIWYRILLFIIMYCLLLLFIKSHIKKISLNPESSPTYQKDLNKKISLDNYVYEENPQTKRTFITYVIFLSIVLCSILIVTSIDSLRDYTIVFLIALFLIGGLIAGVISCHDQKKVLKSFLKGVISSIPAILMVLMASSIKFILEEGMILDTISNSITLLVQNQSSIMVALIIFVIILVLEFMISSSTAKAVFVMGILAGTNVGLSKELLVLIYILGDGFTNVLFPTSPVLLIALSMTGISYINWLKKSKWLFLLIFIIIILLIIIGVLIKY